MTKKKLDDTYDEDIVSNNIKGVKSAEDIRGNKYQNFLKSFELKRLNRCKSNHKPYDFLGNEIEAGGWVVFPTTRNKDRQYVSSNSAVLALRYVVKTFKDRVWILNRDGRRPIKVPSYKLLWIGFDYPNKPTEEDLEQFRHMTQMELEQLDEKIKALQLEEGKRKTYN